MFKQLVDGFYVAGQLQREDFAAAAAEGVRTVINNRPDGEAPDQLSHADAQEAAKAAGMAYHYLPVVNGQLNIETVEALRALLDEIEGPVLAYCRSGTRSTFLWAFAKGDSLPTDDIVEAAAAAGYDLGGIAPQLAAMRQR
ncbi:MAG: TIGR01244 family phosphatase [Geminicoccaceae bacterium]|nr:MAG: TIGR01244 family phosphatase [Geminicoccaceae bacterium]